MNKTQEHRKLGFLSLDQKSNLVDQIDELNGLMKILFLKKGRLIIDFQQYDVEVDTLFFINHSQIFNIDVGSCVGYMLFYSRDFYCVEINDSEVACHGILYNNVYEIPAIELHTDHSVAIEGIFENIKYETENLDTANEEMLQLLLKQLIIKGTRIWKLRYNLNDDASKQDLDFVRKFSQQVEKNFKFMHNISDYADILNVTPKNLNKKVTQLGYQAPKQIIVERLMLEAKRLLAHSILTVKEIGYALGYEDDAYFVRFFTKQTGVSPLQFRKLYISQR
ncbi:helix-turn-helix domain-containing protein [Chishuiella changwenlii]|uniref:helix-turn-helix domain-containing protein n=1 Tax=Chishuiella changwenlii TaxID=1434701 RepID=UPI002FDA1489